MNKFFILIVEDDADDRFLIENAFTETGYKEKLVFVENGVQAMEYLTSLETSQLSIKNYPKIILLDLNMPKKDGREVLKEIKEHPTFKQIPVIVFSTTKNDVEVQKCYQLGANSYVAKPISFEGLLRVIRDISEFWLITAITPP